MGLFLTVFLIFWCLFFCGTVISALFKKSSRSYDDEPVNSFDLQKNSIDTSVSSVSHLSQNSANSEDLRGDFTPKQVKGLTSQQKEALKSIMGSRWLTAYDSCAAALLPVVDNLYQSDAAQEVYATLSQGDRISLVQEPNNEYDDTAVKVMAKRYKIGYIPDEYSSQIYWHILLNRVAGCCVYTPSNGNCKGLEIVIFLKEKTDEEN